MRTLRDPHKAAGRERIQGFNESPEAHRGAGTWRAENAGEREHGADQYVLCATAMADTSGNSE